MIAGRCRKYDQIRGARSGEAYLSIKIAKSDLESNEKTSCSVPVSTCGQKARMNQTARAPRRKAGVIIH